MPKPTYLSEEDEAAEAATQGRLRDVDARARGIEERRHRAIAEADRMDEDLEALRQVWSVKEREVGDARLAFREIGERLDELKIERGQARAQIDAFRANLDRLPRPKGEASRQRAERLRRQILELQVRQQTVALSLLDENAIIERIRELQKSLTTADAAVAVDQKEHQDRTALEGAIRQREANAARAAEEGTRLHAQRRAAFESIQARRAIAEKALLSLREKVRARDALDALAKELTGQLAECEREIGDLLRESRDRRREARDALHEFGRRARLPEKSPTDLVEQRISDLLRNGRIRLGD